MKALQARGVQCIDVGCLQVNLMYHPDAFASLEQAFDPRINPDCAARLLNALYADAKDWGTAIAAYHLETPSLGDAYRVLVMARWQDGDLNAGAPAHGPYGDFARTRKAYDDDAHRAFAPRSRV